MATILLPQPYGPSHGILLNRSPSVSPYRHSSSLPPLGSSNPAYSSSTSSTSDLATDSEYYLSSSPATSSRPARLPRDAQDHKPRSDSIANSRRIRFAPLPDPQRNIFVADGDELPFVFLDDADESKPTQNLNTSSSGKPSALSVKDQDSRLKSVHAGSLLFSTNCHSSSESTPTLASTATLTPPFPTSTPSQLHEGDWSMVQRSSRPSSLHSEDDGPRRSNSAGNKWSKKLFRPFLSPLSSSSAKCGTQSTDDLRSSASTTSLNSMVPMPPHSPGGSSVEGCYAGMTSPKSGNQKVKKKRDKGPESEFGAPLYRWSSEGDSSGVKQNKNDRPRAMSELKEAGTGGSKGQELYRPRSRNGGGTKLLNGRVYGGRRLNGSNPFANVKTQDPEFVEWGYGGMGSVQSAGVGANIWAKVQSSGGVSVGHHDEPTSKVGSTADDDDDGSGMAWVKKRRARKQEEQKGAHTNGQVAAMAGSSPASEPHANMFNPDTPARGEVLGQTVSASPSPVASPLPEGNTSPSTEEKHLLTAIKLPPVHHHRGHSHGAFEKLSKMEMERRDSADTVQGARPVPEIANAEINGPMEDGRPRADSMSSQASAESSTSSNSDNEDADAEDEDLESPRSGEGEEEEEEEEDDDEEPEGRARARLTAVGAGVEKISRHLENAAMPEAGPE